jgi:hypothetical protein
MSNAKRDSSNIANMMGVSSIDGITPTPLTVDPITGYLLINIVDTSSAVSPVLRKNAQHDSNSIHTMLGWNGSATQALITHNNYLAVQLN